MRRRAALCGEGRRAGPGLKDVRGGTVLCVVWSLPVHEPYIESLGGRVVGAARRRASGRRDVRSGGCWGMHSAIVALLRCFSVLFGASLCSWSAIENIENIVSPEGGFTRSRADGSRGCMHVTHARWPESPYAHTNAEFVRCGGAAAV